MTDQTPEDGTTNDGGPPAYADPADFPDGDDIDSAAVDEPDDGYVEPVDPEAEPVEDMPGGDA
jgi:hypothetical protein